MPIGYKRRSTHAEISSAAAPPSRPTVTLSIIW